MTVAYLHNFIRRNHTSRNLYTPPGTFDHADDDGEFVQVVRWRSARSRALANRYSLGDSHRARTEGTERARTNARVCAHHKRGFCLHPSAEQGAAVAERLDCSPTTKVNRVESAAGSLPDFSKRESCRTIPLVGEFSRGSAVSPALAFRRCSILISFHPHRLSKSRCSNLSTQLNNSNGNTARLARRSDEELDVRVSVARIAHSLHDLGRRTLGTWESCREMPMVGGFSRGSPPPQPLATRRRYIRSHFGSQDLDAVFSYPGPRFLLVNESTVTKSSGRRETRRTRHVTSPSWETSQDHGWLFRGSRVDYDEGKRGGVEDWGLQTLSSSWESAQLIHRNFSPTRSLQAPAACLPSRIFSRNEQILGGGGGREVGSGGGCRRRGDVASGRIGDGALEPIGYHDMTTLNRHTESNNSRPSHSSTVIDFLEHDADSASDFIGWVTRSSASIDLLRLDAECTSEFFGWVTYSSVVIDFVTHDADSTYVFFGWITYSSVTIDFFGNVINFFG
ncbi:hypothetical protein PR048_015025 [Dryococelus australis]|uniref:Uncharacterized protein n=1 Tax=Dryococelus australis TaxID=614101 RepID=A0ABQ9HFS2_9NEOP|nr:hypothetical protein PR048_015025 [Dryococelus australis]